MIGFVLLLTAVLITLTNGIPIEINSPYLDYPEEYKENYKNHYFNLPKTSYELRPQLLQSSSKRDNKGMVPEDAINNKKYKLPQRENIPWTETKFSGPTKSPSYVDRIGKRSFKSQELYEKLILPIAETGDLHSSRPEKPDCVRLWTSLLREIWEALGLDYIEASNLIESLHQFEQKIDDKNYH